MYLNSYRWLILLFGGLLSLALCKSNSSAALITAGELVVDLRAMDLNASAPTWTNRDITGSVVGNFATKGGGTVNVATIGGYKALNVDINLNNSVLSASQTPNILESNSTRSVEAWIYPNSTLGGQAVASWGQAGTATLSSFRYANNTGNGLFSGWFIDAAGPSLKSVPGNMSSGLMTAQTYGATSMACSSRP